MNLLPFKTIDEALSQAESFRRCLEYYEIKNKTFGEATPISLEQSKKLISLIFGYADWIALIRQIESGQGLEYFAGKDKVPVEYHQLADKCIAIIGDHIEHVAFFAALREAKIGLSPDDRLNPTYYEFHVAHFKTYLQGHEWEILHRGYSSATRYRRSREDAILLDYYFEKEKSRTAGGKTTLQTKWDISKIISIDLRSLTATEVSTVKQYSKT